jgi:hypothetical protein
MSRARPRSRWSVLALVDGVFDRKQAGRGLNQLPPPPPQPRSTEGWCSASGIRCMRS